MSTGRPEVILVVVVEVSTETTGVALIGAGDTHFQVGAATPQYLQVEAKYTHLPIDIRISPL